MPAATAAARKPSGAVTPAHARHRFFPAGRWTGSRDLDRLHVDRDAVARQRPHALRAGRTGG